MDANRLHLYAELDQKRLRLRKEQEDIEAALKPLEEAILEEITQEGVTSFRVTTPDFGLVNVYLERRVWAKCVDGDWARATQALKSAGLTEYIEVKYNTQSLSAYLRELDRAGEPLPEQLMGAIDAEQRLSVRTRKG